MINVIPKNDLKEHFPDTTCECNPYVEFIEETGETIVVHNSYDGREGLELANEILNK